MKAVKLIDYGLVKKLLTSFNKHWTVTVPENKIPL